MQLRGMRTAAREAGTWTGSIFESIPQPCWLVTQAHSDTQQGIYELLQAIGEKPNEYAARLSTRARIQGHKGAKPFEYTVHVSIGALAELRGIAVTTLQRNLRWLARKHSVRHMQIRKRGDATPTNRDPSVFYLPAYADVLAARRDDPNIATTHGEDDPKRSLQWHNGRANSRRLLTPEQAERWQIAKLPARPKKPATAAVEATPARPAAIAQPHKTPTTSTTVAPDAGRGSGVGVRQSIGVPEFVQKGLDQLCGTFCDLAPVIMAQLRETAAAHGKDFPDDGVVECCKWFLERAGKEKVQAATTTRHAVYRYKVASVGGFLKHCTLNDHDTGGDNWLTVLRYVDNYGQRRKEEDAELEKTIARALKMQRRTPDSESAISFTDSCRNANPELFDRVWVADDLEHGGDGKGSSWANTETGRLAEQLKRSRSFADALDPNFVEGDPDDPDDRGPPSRGP